MFVLLHLLHAANFFVVHSRRWSFASYLAVRHLSRINQRDVFGVLIVTVREILVVVAGVGEVGQVADGGVLVDLVAGRLAGGGLSGDLVRGRWTRR